MCGRSAQTLDTAHLACVSFQAINKSQQRLPPAEGQGSSTNNSSNPTGSSNVEEQEDNHSEEFFQQRDNFNLSPGMDACVIWNDDDGNLVMDRKVWGLVTKAGTKHQPLPKDSKARMGLHFSTLMYNARTDTLYAKPTFSRLAAQKKSCIVAFDGYFEWKSSPLGGGKGKKQPYFVYGRREKQTQQQSGENHHPYLLMPGLWSRVPTGLDDEPILDTFTILTTAPLESYLDVKSMSARNQAKDVTEPLRFCTHYAISGILLFQKINYKEACKQIEWLHHRMPVCVWDMKLALEWLENPSERVKEALDNAAKSENNGFDWHMVTTDMSSVKFRDKSAIQAIAAPKSVASFFITKGDLKNKSNDCSKASSKSNFRSPSKRDETKDSMKRN